MRKPFKRFNILLACLIPQPTGTRRPHQWLSYGRCRLPALRRLKPFVRRYMPKPFKRFNILLACLIPQPTGTRRPHQRLLMGVQACRLPALRRLKPLKPLKRLKPLKLCIRVSERPTAQAKATPRPHQRLLLDGPACRSPGVTCVNLSNVSTFSWHA